MTALQAWPKPVSQQKLLRPVIDSRARLKYYAYAAWASFGNAPCHFAAAAARLHAAKLCMLHGSHPKTDIMNTHMFICVYVQLCVSLAVGFWQGSVLLYAASLAFEQLYLPIFTTSCLLRTFQRCVNWLLSNICVRNRNKLFSFNRLKSEWKVKLGLKDFILYVCSVISSYHIDYYWTRFLVHYHYNKLPWIEHISLNIFYANFSFRFQFKLIALAIKVF